MRKTFIYLILVLLCSCNTSPKHDVNSKRTMQDDLISFFKEYIEEEYKMKNDIQKKELYSKRESALYSYIDSVVIFKSLEGVIKDIKLSDVSSNSFHVLTYTLEIAPERFFKLTLKCENIVHKDSLGNDYIYNKIKELPDNSIVFFDGVISVDPKKELPRLPTTYFNDNISFSYPKYEFHLIDISKSQLCDTINENLKTSLLLAKKGYYYNLKQLKKEQFSKSIYDEFANEFKKSAKNLTEEENEYVGRYMTTLMTDNYPR